MHKEIKRFHIESEVADDSMFIRQRDQQENLLLTMMKEGGYIPLLDLGPFWSTRLKEKGSYETVLSIYGIYVGKRKAWLFVGVDGAGKYYPTNTQKSKSNQS